ncbi:hypothetical protein ACGFIY_33010 [Micromonospora chersina]|uniref:hypothetical protein n=1 Tax=Micromonospora chersina TaxID=47854 RepID=UPI00372379EA
MPSSNTTGFSRRRILSTAAAAGAGLAASAVVGRAAAHAAAPATWHLDANGWVATLEFAKRLGDGDPRSLGGGWMANFRDQANETLDPVLAFRAPSGAGVNFLRILSSHKIQIFWQDPGATTGYFKEYTFGLSGVWNSSGSYPWRITGGQSPSRPEDFIEVDTSERHRNRMLRTEAGFTSSPLLSEYHWYDGPATPLRQMWGTLDGVAVVGLTYKDMAYQGSRKYGDTRLKYYQKPLHWFKPLDTQFDRIENWIGMDHQNEVYRLGPLDDIFIGTAAWRDGVGRVSRTRSNTPTVPQPFTFDSVNNWPAEDQWYFDPWIEGQSW